MQSKSNNLKARNSSTMRKSVASSKQWSSILNSLSDPISIHAQSGEIVWANEKCCEVYSKSLSELTGLTCAQAFCDGPVSATRDPVAEMAQPEGVVTLGNKVWSVMIKPLAEPLSNDRASGFIRVMSDVTAERGTHRKLLEAERFASLGQMLFGIAHNVGTPLNIISGYAEFLLMRMDPDEQGHKELSAILDQAKRIAVLLNEALDLARPGRRPTSAIDIKALLSDSLDLAAHYLRRDGIQTHLTCATSAPLIYGEAPRLRQAFFCLLLNAGKSVGPGGRVEILIAESREMPDAVSVRLLGSEGTGQVHDFARSLESLVGAGKQTKTAGDGLSLARHTFDEAGAIVIFDEFDERGVSILVHLPVNAS